MTETVSIIIPAFNVENEVERSVNSIIEQTYRDIEIIIINDGSTDRTLSIIERQALIDDRIKIINQENAGQSVARNKGIDVATGRYIYFFDADDFLQKNAIFELVSNIKQNNTDVVTFNADAIDLNKKNQKPYVRHNVVGNKGVYSRNQFLYNNKWNLTPVWIYFFQRSFLLDHQIRFVEDIIYEDNMFYIEIMLHLKRISIVDKTLFFYQKREHSTITSLENYKFKLESLDTLKKLTIEERCNYDSNDIFLKFLKYRYEVINNAIISHHFNGSFYSGMVYLVKAKKINLKNIFLLCKLTVKQFIR